MIKLVTQDWEAKYTPSPILAYSCRFPWWQCDLHLVPPGVTLLFACNTTTWLVKTELCFLTFVEGGAREYEAIYRHQFYNETSGGSTVTIRLWCPLVSIIIQTYHSCVDLPQSS